MSAKTKVTKTKTALKQETYTLSDLKHDPHCGCVELGGSVSVFEQGLPPARPGQPIEEGTIAAPVEDGGLRGQC
jgi:hypothetical protein